MKTALLAAALALGACTGGGSALVNTPAPVSPSAATSPSGPPNAVVTELPSPESPTPLAGVPPPSPPPNPPPGATIRPCPPAGAAPAGPLAVVDRFGASGSTSHTIYLVGLDGCPVASVTAANRTAIATWPAASPIVGLWDQPVSTSNTRAYYLDGDNSLRFLSRDGSTAEVARIPGDASKRSFFAVSPDDGEVAVTVLDYSTPPIVHMQFYVQDLRSGTSSIVTTPPNVFFWPLGWHSGKVVVQVGQPIPVANTGPYPTAGMEDRLIDPTTGASTSVGGPSCLPEVSLASPAGIVCGEPSTNAFRVVGWDGQPTSFTGPYGWGGASLSTDGRAVATSDISNILINTVGGTAQRTHAGRGFLSAGGWLDASHFVYFGAESPRPSIYDTTAGVVTPITVTNVLVARIPGGL